MFGFPKGVLDGIEKMKTEQFAYLTPKQELLVELVRRKESCAYIIAGSTLFYGNLIMAWPKNFPYGPLFDY